MKKIVLLLAILVQMAQAQYGKFFYDVEHEIEIEGKVVGLGEVETHKKGIPMVYANVEVESDTFMVILGPPWFIEDLPKKGERIHIKGSLNEKDSRKIVVASYMRNRERNVEIQLRDKQGFPLWRCMERMRSRRGR